MRSVLRCRSEESARRAILVWECRDRPPRRSVGKGMHDMLGFTFFLVSLNFFSFNTNRFNCGKEGREGRNGVVSADEQGEKK